MSDSFHHMDLECWNAGDLGWIPGSGRSLGEGKWQPTPVLLPGEFHGSRSLVGYSPWGHKEWDMNERLQDSLSMGFSRQEYWSGFPFPSPGDPDPGIVGRRFTV